MSGITDRDHFAAAALTGLLAQGDDGSFSEESYARGAYRWADAMLRERERTSVGVAGMDPATDRKSAATHRACASPCSQPFDSAPITLEAYRRFVGEVMNWISEATGFLHDDVLRTDDARDCIHNACMLCWDAFDRIAYPTIHGAAPAATPDSPKPIKGGVSDRSKPINGPDPDSRVWETPVHTPATHATRGEGSERREGTEPEAWAVCTPDDGDWSPCFFHEPHAQRCANAIVGEKNVVPLYRSPTLTDAEVTFLLRERDLLDADDEGDRKTLEIIAGLLARLGGGR